jgi:hypothetical protein
LGFRRFVLRTADVGDLLAERGDIVFSAFGWNTPPKLSLNADPQTKFRKPKTTWQYLTPLFAPAIDIRLPNPTPQRVTVSTQRKPADAMMKEIAMRMTMDESIRR